MERSHGQDGNATGVELVDGFAGVRSGRLDLPFRFRPAFVWIQRSLAPMLFDSLFDNAVRHREHLIYEFRKSFILG